MCHGYLLDQHDRKENKHNRREDKNEGQLSISNKQKKTKNINIENPELEERYQDIIVTKKKKTAAKKENEAHTHEIITNTGCSSSCDLRAGERLPKQRPLGDEHLERIPEEHLGAQMIRQVGEAGSIVLHNSRSSSVFKNDSKEIQETTSAAAKKKEECVDKDAEILRLIEERRSMHAQRRKTTIEGPEQKHQKCIREKKE